MKSTNASLIITNLSELPAETADYLEQLTNWARILHEAEEEFDPGADDEVQYLHLMNAEAAKMRCSFMLRHLDNGNVFERLANAIRDAKGL